MARTNKTKYILLGLISEGIKTGYDIKKRVENQMAYFWTESFGQIYPNLKKLEKEGYISSKKIKLGGRNKIEYSISEKGKKEFIKYMEMPVEEEIGKYEILVKLSFGELVKKDIHIKNIKDFLSRHENILKELEEIEHHIDEVPRDEKSRIYIKMTISCGKKVHNSFVEWAKESIDILNDMEEERWR